MRYRMQTVVWCTAVLFAVGLFTITAGETTHFNKVQVGDRIRKVENGVDDFEKYLTTRGDNAKDKAASSEGDGEKKARQGGNRANKGAGKDQAKQTKDELQDAMDDLNRTTNRLR